MKTFEQNFRVSRQYHVMVAEQSGVLVGASEPTFGEIRHKAWLDKSRGDIAHFYTNTSTNRAELVTENTVAYVQSDFERVRFRNVLTPAIIDFELFGGLADVFNAGGGGGSARWEWDVAAIPNFVDGTTYIFEFLRFEQEID